MRDLLLKLCNREDLTREEAREAFLHVMSGEATDAQIGGLLVGLAAKGSTVDELVGAATVMREKVIPIGNPPGAGGGGAPVGGAPVGGVPVGGASDTRGKRSVILDTCGTGGSAQRKTGIFNISTTAALIAAAAGVRVVKHGNRSASSKSGSADVLEKLGVKIDLPPAQTDRCLEETGICFAFARNHHPAMKHVAAARTSLGIPTVFNLLGPLTNPGGAKHQLLGVFAPELTDKLAAVLREMGSTRAWVVHATDGLDELSTLGETRVSDLQDGSIRTFKIDPREYGLPYARLSDLQVTSVEGSAAVIREVLGGKPGPARDISLLNAAAALVVAGVCVDLPHGLADAATAIDSGRGMDVLEALVRTSNAG